MECTGSAKVWEMAGDARFLGFSCNVAGHSSLHDVAVVAAQRAPEEARLKRTPRVSRGLRDVSLAFCLGGSQLQFPDI